MVAFQPTRRKIGGIEPTLAFIRDFRTRLPAGGHTAAAIDRGAPWEEISECAEAEGVHKLAAALFNPEREQARA